MCYLLQATTYARHASIIIVTITSDPLLMILILCYRNIMFPMVTLLAPFDGRFIFFRLRGKLAYSIGVDEVLWSVLFIFLCTIFRPEGVPPDHYDGVLFLIENGVQLVLWKCHVWDFSTVPHRIVEKNRDE